MKKAWALLLLVAAVGHAQVGTYDRTTIPPSMFSGKVGAAYVPPSARTNFYATDPGGVNLWTMSDRLFLGAAVTINPQSSANTTGYPAWFYPTYLLRGAQFGDVSTNGLWAVVGGAQSADNTGAQTGGPLGVFGLNNRSGANFRASYFEYQANSTAGATSSGYAQEWQIKDQSGAVNSLTPYGGSGYGSFGATANCGGDASYGGAATTNCVAVFRITRDATSGVQWNNGLVFTRDSLAGTTGAAAGGTTANAISMGYGQNVTWYSTNNYPSGHITSTSTASSDTSHTITFGSNLIDFANINSSNTAEFQHTSNGINYLQFQDGATGQPARINAVSNGSTDASVGINIVPVGTGTIQLGGAVATYNVVQVLPTTTGNPVSVAAAGVDTNLGIQLASKGTGAANLKSNNVNVVAAYGDVASDSGSTWELHSTGAGTGIAYAQAAGSDTDVSLQFRPKGAGTVSTTGAFSATKYTSTVATGTAPLAVTSTTNVANLNASLLNGATFAAPAAIGSGTPAAGTFTALTSTGFSFQAGTSYSGATWANVSPVFNGVAMTLNDTTASGTNTFDAAYSMQAANFTSTGGASTTISNANQFFIAAPTCSGGVVCTNLNSLYTAGKVAFRLGMLLDGGTVSINSSSNNATNINTGTSNGAVHIGDGSGNNAITIGNGTGLVNVSSLENAAGTTFTAATMTGCGTTNGTPGTLSGGSQTGSFVGNSSGTTCSVVITPNGATGLTAAHGWYCAGADITSAVALVQSAKSTTTCTLKGTINATTDTIVWHGVAY